MVRECTLYYFSSFKFVEVCVRVEDMVCQDECSIGASEEVCILFLLGTVFRMGGQK